nr:hypothetical protein [Tanacetum cinerariifolium]
MGWDTIQLENVISTISQEYLLEFTSEYGIPESLHPELPGQRTLLWSFVDEKVFPTIVDWSINAPKGEMPSADFYSAVAVATLNTCCTPIEKQPKALLCLVGLSRNYFLGDDVHPTFFFDNERGSAPNPTKVKTGTGTRPRVAHEVPLLTATASRVIDMRDTIVASGSSRTPASIGKSPLDFADEDPPLVITKRGDEATAKAILKSGPEKKVAAIGPVVNKRRRKRG